MVLPLCVLKITIGKGIDEKIRSIVVRVFDSGKSKSEISDLLQLSRHEVKNIPSNLIKRYKTTGSVATKPGNVGNVNN